MNKTSNKFLSKEILDNTGARSEAPTRQSFRRLSQQTGVPMSSVKAATKLLRLKPYKFTAVLKLQDADCVATVQFCKWFCETVCSGEVNTLLTYFTDDIT